jgi:hypothetical protein
LRIYSAIASERHQTRMAQTNPEDVSPEEIDRQAKAMRDELRKEAAAWTAAHSATNHSAAPHSAAPHSAAAERSAATPGAARPARSATPTVRQTPPAAPVAGAKPVRKTNKPFRMSYDGVTTAEHIATMLARGAR